MTAEMKAIILSTAVVAFAVVLFAIAAMRNHLCSESVCRPSGWSDCHCEDGRAEVLSNGDVHCVCTVKR